MGPVQNYIQKLYPSTCIVLLTAMATVGTGKSMEQISYLLAVQEEM